MKTERRCEELDNHDVSLLVEEILDSYCNHELTCRIDKSNMVNRGILVEIVEELRKIVFPGFFDNNKVRSEYSRYLVGEKLEYVQYHLKKQIAKALDTAKSEVDTREDIIERADDITYKFLRTLPKIREYLATDVQAAFNGDPAAFSTDEIIFCYPGMLAISVYRISHELYLLGVPLIPRIISEYAHSVTGIDIHPGADIGKYFFIDHGTGHGRRYRRNDRYRQERKDIPGRYARRSFYEKGPAASWHEAPPDARRQRYHLLRNIGARR